MAKEGKEGKRGESGQTDFEEEVGKAVKCGRFGVEENGARKHGDEADGNGAKGDLT